MIPMVVVRRFLHACRKIMTTTSECLFCQIIARERPARLVYEDADCVAFEDVNPKAPLHVLVVPRKHIPTLKDGAREDEGLLGRLLLVAGRVAKDMGLNSFRTVINTNAEAGQTIYHLHVHVLGGRTMRWPPG
jgi:histidine triad (HIT) family protein